MNGFGSLAILLLAGQITANTPPQLPLGTPGVGAPAPTATLEDRKSYGWDLDVTRDNELYYIIQISSAEAEVLMHERIYRPGEKPREKETNMPPELVGVVQRVVVRIGDDILPRNPPLAEVARMQRRNLQASLDGLGAGRMAEVESSAILPAGQRPLPANPNRPGTSGEVAPPLNIDAFGSGSSNVAGAGNTPASPGGVSGSSTTGSTGFLNETRSRTGNPVLPPSQNGAGGAEVTRLADASTVPGRNQPFSTRPNSRATAPVDPPSMPPLNTFGANQRFGDTANNSLRNGQQPGSASSQWTANNGQRNPNSAQASDPYASAQPPQYGQTSRDSYSGNQYRQGQSNLAGQGNGTGQPTGQGNLYNNQQQAPAYANQPTNPQTGMNNYTSAPGGYDYSRQNDTRGQQQQNNAPYPRIATNTSPAQQSFQPPATNLAAQTPKPSTSSASDMQRDSDKDTETKTAGAASTSSSSKTAQTQGIVTVLFLLSLVFNIYLGLLIRKLLGRYRNVLMNLRTQAA